MYSSQLCIRDHTPSAIEKLRLKDQSYSHSTATIDSLSLPPTQEPEAGAQMEVDFCLVGGAHAYFCIYVFLNSLLDSLYGSSFPKKAPNATFPPMDMWEE